MVLGHGRDSILTWSGAVDERMFWSNGAARQVFLVSCGTVMRKRELALITTLKLYMRPEYFTSTWSSETFVKPAFALDMTKRWHRLK